MRNSQKLKKDLLSEFELKVHFNVYDMSDDELRMVVSTKKIIEKFKWMKIDFLRTNQSRFQSVYSKMINCLVECFDCLLYPSNKFADLSLRIYMENLIILNFLVHNDDEYTENWYYWSVVSKKYYDKKYFYFIDEFKLWYDKTIDKIEKLYGKEKSEKLFARQYGWIYNKKCDFNKMNLKTIAELCDAELVYDYFELLSQRVHSNTVQEQYDVRFENNTFNICRGILDAINLTFTHFYYFYDKRNLKSIINMMDKARIMEEKFHNKFLEDLNTCNENMKNNYLKNKQTN